MVIDFTLLCGTVYFETTVVKSYDALEFKENWIDMLEMDKLSISITLTIMGLTLTEN